MRVSETIFFNPIVAPVLGLALAVFGSLSLAVFSAGDGAGVIDWLRPNIIALYFLWILIASAALGIPFRRRLHHPTVAFVVFGAALIAVMPFFMEFYSAKNDRTQAYIFVCIASLCYCLAALIPERAEITFMRRFVLWYCIILWPLLLLGASDWMRRAAQGKI